MFFLEMVGGSWIVVRGSLLVQLSDPPSLTVGVPPVMRRAVENATVISGRTAIDKGGTPTVRDG